MALPSLTALAADPAHAMSFGIPKGDQVFSRWFLTDSVPLDLCIPYHHEKWLVALSYIVAAFASYTAFHVIERIRSASDVESRRIWLIIAGCVMGSGIFAMHFIAMLAVRSPVYIHYDVTVTALSALFAIVASGVAFHLVGGRDKESRTRFAIAALVLGSGIGLMHYTGMAALQMAARIYYDPYLFGLSVVVAVLLSACALYVLRKSSQWRRFSSAGIYGARLCGALVMGLAITLMHYTGMFATYLYPEFGPGSVGATLDGTTMSLAIGTITFVTGGFAIIAALLDHRATVAEASRAQTESFLQTVIDNSADGILTLDVNQRVKTCNPVGARIFGRAPHDVIGQKFNDLIDDDPQPALVQLREARVVRADGTECNIEYAINEMQYSGQRMFTSLVRDITERKRAEAALRASEERFRNLVANVPGVVFQRRRSADGVLSLTYVSEQIRELAGLEPDEVVVDYTKLLDAVHPEDKQAFLGSIFDSVSTLGPAELMYRMTAKSGQQVWVRSFARPRPLENGDILWDGLLLDVTNSINQGEENKMLETKLRQAQKLEALGTLAGGIAHEFNNMLVPIMGLTEITLRDLPEESRAHKNLKVVVNNGKRAAQLIEKILSFSRQEENAVTEIDLFEVISEAVELLQVATPATIMLRTRLDSSVGLILADETQIHQIIMNLASNARHAMEGKVGELTIELETAIIDPDHEIRHANLRPGKYARLSVKDSGHGIDKATLSRIFEPFFTTKRVGKGTGLGLSVIHGIVTSYGGAIDVESILGVGTTFDVYLPLKDGAVSVKGGECAA